MKTQIYWLHTYWENDTSVVIYLTAASPYIAIQELIIRGELIHNTISIVRLDDRKQFHATSISEELFMSMWVILMKKTASVKDK